MAAWKCAQCMLVNRETDQACRRCGAGLGAPLPATNVASPRATTYASTVNEPARIPAYGLPQSHQPAQQMPNVWGPQSLQTARFQNAAVPSAGVWRDGTLLVMHKGATLPNRCLKCNAPGDGHWVTRTLRPTDSTLAFLRFVPYVRLIYFIWRAASQGIEVSFGLCHKHHSQMDMLRNAGNLIRWAGFAALVYGIYMETLLWLPGLVVSVIGSGLMTTPVVNIARMDDYYLWISGVDQGYLASLPPVHG